jgi:hypothetical protein
VQAPKEFAAFHEVFNDFVTRRVACQFGHLPMHVRIPVRLSVPSATPRSGGRAMEGRTESMQFLVDANSNGMLLLLLLLFL